MNQPLIHHVHNSSNNNNNNKSPTTMTTTQEPLTAFFNFHKVLETTSSRDCFREFLTQLHSVEQLDFLDQVLMLKQMELYNHHHEQPYKNEEEKEQLEEKCALDLLNNFVRTGSPKEVNIDREMRLCCEDMVMRLKREKMEQRKNCKNQNRENGGENINAGEKGSMMMMEMRHFHCAFREIEFQIFYQLKTDMFDMFLQSSLFEMFIGRLALEKSPNLLSLHLPSCSGNDNGNGSNNSKGKNRSNALRHSISYTNVSSSATNMNGSGGGGGGERNGSSSSNGLLRRSLRRNITSLMSNGNGNGNGDSNGDVSSSTSTSDQGSNNLVTSLMKRVKTRRQSQQETIEELYNAQQVMIEQMNRTIKDLYAKMVEKEREIHVLRNQLQQHRIVPHGLEYYHNTSGTSGSIRPISPHLLPPPASSPPLLSSSSSKRFISSQNSRILDGDDNGNNGGAGGSGQATRSSSTSGPESPLQVRPKVFAVRPPANRKISNPESVRPNSTEPNTSPNKQHNNL